MTNTDTIDMTATNARRIAAIRALREAPAPIMPAVIRRPAPKARNRYRRRRTIR